jgi:glycosyltransferase involved in cell wall biosynthesis
VYDAVAMGIPVVLSDIPVNCEIADYANLVYFRASDPEHLAQQMRAVQNLGYQRPTAEELRAAGRERTLKFGKRLLEAVEYVTGA